MKDLSIIIVSWNVRDYLEACLSSINANHGSLDLEVIVVDSGSLDGSQQMVKQSFPGVRLIDCGENVGFPRGNNLGLAEANGQYTLLLNPDTEIVGDALVSMINYLDSHSEVGLVGGQLLNSDGTIQSSKRRFPTLGTAIFESTWLEAIAPRKLLTAYYVEDFPSDTPTQVDWLTGACLMTRRKVVEQVGPMDEAYFMYSEELDWCRRIKEAGWQIVYLPEAKVVHHIGKSSDQAVAERHLNFQRAKLRYFQKYHGLLTATILRGILLLNYAWQLLIEVCKGLVGHKRKLRWQRARAYWRVLRSGLKPAGY